MSFDLFYFCAAEPESAPPVFGPRQQGGVVVSCVVQTNRATIACRYPPFITTAATAPMTVEIAADNCGVYSASLLLKGLISLPTMAIQASERCTLRP